MDVSKFDEGKKRAVAVAYMVQNPDNAPEAVKKFVDKLVACEGTAQKIMSALQSARNAVSELEQRLSQTVGSITTLAEIAGDDLTTEQIEIMCEKYEPPKDVNEEPDMAGVTAKQITPPRI